MSEQNSPTTQNIFATLRGPGQIWAIGAIHGEPLRLAAIHQRIAQSIAPGDHLIYLGNIMGFGPDVLGAVRQALLFRRTLMARPGFENTTITFLRGAQEEMWQKLLQLQFAPNPAQVLDWMVRNGAEATIRAYGGSVEDGQLSAREGTMALTKWTTALRANFRSHDGHMTLISVLKHAAFTEDQKVLLVHAGFDPSRPLSAQADSFWWGGKLWDELDKDSRHPFQMILRGSDRRRSELPESERKFDGRTLTLDGGCGFGGPLIAACIAPNGSLLEVIEA